MKKAVVLTALVLVLATAGLAQNLPRFELNLYGGYGLKNVNTGTYYEYSWTGNYYWLDQLGSYSDFAATSSGGVAFGAWMTYYIHPNFGIGLGFNYFKTAVDAVTDSNMWWSWTYSGTYYAYDDVLDTPVSMTGTKNYFQSMQISLDLVGRFGNERFQGYLSAGPSLFMNKLFLESEIAYAAYWANYAVDFFRVATEMNESWSAIGANFGAGFSFWMTPQFGFFFDARYFLAGSKTFDWTFYTGDYDGEFGNFSYDFDDYDIQDIYDYEEMTSLTIKPSFFQISGGFKIRLY
jgi:hypothetical protein